jgi:hypothetical protein
MRQTDPHSQGSPEIGRSPLATEMFSDGTGSVYLTQTRVPGLRSGMPHVGKYFLALRPRTALWFVVQTAALIATPIGLIATNYRPNRSEEWAMWAAIELAIIVVVLFISGYVAWSKETAKNENLWRGLNNQQRDALANRLRPFPVFPEISIYTNRLADCRTLAADLSDALARAGGQRGYIPHHQVVERWIPSGLVILSRPSDNRGKILQSALREVVKIDARLELDDDVPFQIQIGAKVS